MQGKGVYKPSGLQAWESIPAWVFREYEKLLWRVPGNIARNPLYPSCIDGADSFEMACMANLCTQEVICRNAVMADLMGLASNCGHWAPVSMDCVWSQIQRRWCGPGIADSRERGEHLYIMVQYLWFPVFRLDLEGCG